MTSSTEEKLHPARPLALRIGFNSPEKIALRYDADDVAIAVQHRQATDPVLKHEVRRLQDRCLGLHRNDITRHDVRGFHHKSPGVVEAEAYTSSSFNGSLRPAKRAKVRPHGSPIVMSSAIASNQGFT
jgi:hypothetical protein